MTRRMALLALCCSLLVGSAVAGRSPSAPSSYTGVFFRDIDKSVIDDEEVHIPPISEPLASHPLPIRDPLGGYGTPKTDKQIHSSVTTSSSTNVLHSVLATWYCLKGVSRCTRGYPGGYYAAISQDLRFLRGREVLVTYGDRSVRVTVIDCLCSRAGGIDLYGDAFRQLAPLSTGKLRVTLSW